MEWLLFDELAGEAVWELLRAVRGTFLCHSTAERLRRNVEQLLPLVQNHHAGHRMEVADRGIARWLARHAPAHVLDGVRRLRDEADAWIGRLERCVEEVAAAATAQTSPSPPAMSVPVALPLPPKAMGMAMEVGVERKRLEEERRGVAWSFRVAEKGENGEKWRKWQSNDCIFYIMANRELHST